MIWEMMFREFGRHKLRTMLTMLGVTIGIFLVITVSSFSEGIIYYVNDRISITSGLIIVVEKGMFGPMIQKSEIDFKLMDEIKDISGVERVAGILYADFDGIGTVMGVSHGTEDMIRGANIKIDKGREAEEGMYEIEMGSKYADEHGYDIGDTVSIGGGEFEVAGIMEETGKDEIDNSVEMWLTDLQELTGNKEKISLIIVQPSTPRDADYIEQEINDNFDDVSAATDKSLMNSVNKMLSQLSIMTFALGSIAALISGIVIMNVMIISVRERRREIGTLKAIGATNRQILFSVILESTTISLLGAFVGLVLSYGGVFFVNTILLRPIALITPRLIITSILFAVFIGLVSGLLPARQAAGLNPVEAIRYE